MEQTMFLKCPKCGKQQNEDIYELSEGDCFQDSFQHHCDNEECQHEFTVEFEFKAFVKCS